MQPAGGGAGGLRKEGGRSGRGGWPLAGTCLLCVKGTVQDDSGQGMKGSRARHWLDAVRSLCIARGRGRGWKEERRRSEASCSGGSASCIRCPMLSAAALASVRWLECSSAAPSFRGASPLRPRVPDREIRDRGAISGRTGLDGEDRNLWPRSFGGESPSRWGTQRRCLRPSLSRSRSFLFPHPSSSSSTWPARDGCTTGREEVTSCKGRISAAVDGSTGANRVHLKPAWHGSGLLCRAGKDPGLRQSPPRKSRWRAAGLEGQQGTKRAVSPLRGT